MALLSANVAANATLIKGVGVTSVGTPDGTGTYEVIFDRNVSGCAYTATSRSFDVRIASAATRTRQRQRRLYQFPGRSRRVIHYAVLSDSFLRELIIRQATAGRRTVRGFFWGSLIEAHSSSPQGFHRLRKPFPRCGRTRCGSSQRKERMALTMLNEARRALRIKYKRAAQGPPFCCGCRLWRQKESIIAFLRPARRCRLADTLMA